MTAFHNEREALPEHLRPVFDRLVEQYKYYALLHHGKAFVSVKVIANLVRNGWRELK